LSVSGLAENKPQNFPANPEHLLPEDRATASQKTANSKPKPIARDVSVASFTFTRAHRIITPDYPK
jgi:hypothetical protein